MSNAPEEDDRTILSPAGDGLTTSAGQAPADDDEDGHALPTGTLIGEFELRAKIGEGGFSIVYLAWDHSLERKVALKEYMPGSIASRRGPTTVAPRSERHRSTYEAGLKSFVNEAKLLAQFDHPSLVKVYRFWEANGTAYMVMPLYEGETLKDRIQADRSQVSEAWLRGILTPLCDALRLIHGEQCYHRDIAPDNIILLEGSGRPLLLDFGAARRVIGDMTQALTVILKPGYAPVEQYAELPDMKQGPWTDVYALAATVHWVITGSTPPPSVGRLLNDQYQPLAGRAPAGFSPAFLGALDRALAARPELRTQTISDFGQDLGLLQPAPSDTTRLADSPGVTRAATPASTAPPRPAPPAAAPAPAPTRRLPTLALAGAAALAVAAAAAWWLVSRPPTPASPAVPAPSPAPQSSTPGAQPSTSGQAASTPAPQPSTPGQAASTAGQNPPRPEQDSSTAAQNSSSPGQKSPSPAAAPSTPGPESPSPGPAASSAAAKPSTAAPPAPKPRPESSSRDKATAPTPPRKPEKAEKTDKAEKASAPRSAECASILQRISLGENSPELMARLEKARCR